MKIRLSEGQKEIKLYQEEVTRKLNEVKRGQSQTVKNKAKRRG
jgi:hypothetical protein